MVEVVNGDALMVKAGGKVRFPVSGAGDVTVYFRAGEETASRQHSPSQAR